MPDPLERALADLAFGPAFCPTDDAAVDAWLERNAVPEADAAALRAGGLEQLLVYRSLARGNLREALRASIPRTMARLGAVFDEYFARYLAERAPRTHYLRDVTPDFIEFCAPGWATDDRVPRYALDLARHEAVQIDVGAMQTRPRDHAHEELALDSAVRFVEATRLMHYAFAVHRLSEDEADRTAPEQAPTSLLVYRSPDHEVRYLELTPWAAGLLSRLLAGAPLAVAVGEAANEADTPLDRNLLERTTRLLADLAERGALLGKALS